VKALLRIKVYQSPAARLPRSLLRHQPATPATLQVADLLAGPAFEALPLGGGGADAVPAGQRACHRLCAAHHPLAVVFVLLRRWLFARDIGRRGLTSDGSRLLLRRLRAILGQY